MPSAKYSLSVSALRSTKGRTATERPAGVGRLGTAAASESSASQISPTPELFGAGLVDAPAGFVVSAVGPVSAAAGRSARALECPAGPAAVASAGIPRARIEATSSWVSGDGSTPSSSRSRPAKAS